MTTTTTTTTLHAADLVANARQHIQFLQHTHGVLVTQESVRRYTELWLPLVRACQIREGSNQPMIPPVDVAWLWHCHRLAPLVYTKYCRTAFGPNVAPLEATPPFTVQHEDEEEGYPAGSIADQTRTVWRSKYPNEPFFLSVQISAPLEKKKSSAWISTTTPLLNGFDLLESSIRQASFLWQVSGERFSDDTFLRDGVDKYIQFLKLRPKAIETGITLVPTYQIDLLWHTHMLGNLTTYHADCKAIAGSYLHHDDSLTDRSDGGILDVSFTATKSLWETEYQTDYVVPGGMYRGEPPPEYFGPKWHATFLPAATACPQQPEETAFSHWIGKTMGASSTTTSSPSPPLEWAFPEGVTSQGLPAFLDRSTYHRNERLSNKKRNDYILGKTANGTGYFHLETKDAHAILSDRVTAKIQELQQDIACAKCCGGVGVSSKEKDLQKLLDVRTVIRDRLAAPRPSGDLSKTHRNTTGNDAVIPSSTYYSDTGAWLFPTAMYDSCGGPLGVTVFAGGGVVGGDGGAGCGGGGCGGGGCGGGGGGGM